MIFQRKNNIILDRIQLIKNYYSLFGQKIKVTSTLIFSLIILSISSIYFFIQVGLYGILAFLSITIIFLSLDLIIYYFIWRKTSDIYKLKSIILKQDGFLVSYNNHLGGEKILYKNILNIYHKTASISSDLGYHYIIEYENISKENKKLLIPLDFYNVPEFINIIYKRLK